ncbi:MAG: hypothetical protein IJ736_03115, partial [Firmicutes bacterium]|nr:hypothetical protein [Bacillota bacterium]
MNHTPIGEPLAVEPTFSLLKAFGGIFMKRFIFILVFILVFFFSVVTYSAMPSVSGDFASAAVNVAVNAILNDAVDRQQSYVENGEFDELVDEFLSENSSDPVMIAFKNSLNFVSPDYRIYELGIGSDGKPCYSLNVNTPIDAFDDLINLFQAFCLEKGTYDSDSGTYSLSSSSDSNFTFVSSVAQLEFHLSKAMQDVSEVPDIVFVDNNNFYNALFPDSETFAYLGVVYKGISSNKYVFNVFYSNSVFSASDHVKYRVFRFSVSDFSLDSSTPGGYGLMPDSAKNPTTFISLTISDTSSKVYTVDQDDDFSFFGDVAAYIDTNIDSKAKDVSIHYTDGTVSKQREISITVPAELTEDEEGNPVYVPSGSLGLGVSGVVLG